MAFQAYTVLDHHGQIPGKRYGRIFGDEAERRVAQRAFTSSFGVPLDEFHEHRFSRKRGRRIERRTDDGHLSGSNERLDILPQHDRQIAALEGTQFGILLRRAYLEADPCRLADGNERFGEIGLSSHDRKDRPAELRSVLGRVGRNGTGGRCHLALNGRLDVELSGVLSGTRYYGPKRGRGLGSDGDAFHRYYDPPSQLVCINPWYDLLLLPRMDRCEYVIMR